ncbi:sugar phosphate isomerase/epimerase family protein [Desulfitibacter alkalitolerans]|uniref:sugar phosphate isomerase/epimerase family protein n=1 Tax=Desulfitibacter alkalitolerans TaxID=264641 RepID=UPI00047FBCA2|nr:sugar phosphate isomerase/epimerase family protein [Desulfitibacter alkalitolerans]
MKLGINTYSFLWSNDLEDSVKIIADHGFKAIEFLVSPPHFYLNKYKPGMYSKIRKIIEQNNMEVLAVNIPGLDINLASPFPEMRQMSIDLYKRLIDINQELNAKILIVVPGKRHPLLPPDFELIYGYAKDSIEQIMDYASYTDLVFGIETVPAIFLDKVADVQRLVKEFDSPKVKIVYDVANVFMQEDPAEGIKKAADDICLIHISDTKTTKWEHNVIGTGDIDFSSIMDAIKVINYNGYVVLEIINDRGVHGVLESIKKLKE